MKLRYQTIGSRVFALWLLSDEIWFDVCSMFKKKRVNVHSNRGGDNHLGRKVIPAGND